MPAVSGFKPYGGVADKQKKTCVFLLYEEYEALRLSDYEKHSQCESAAIMQISRPTFTRIYMSAREKIAKAFVEGLRIVIEGGKVELDGDWYVCRKCKAVFSNENNESRVCALCGSREIEPYRILDIEHNEEMGTSMAADVKTEFSGTVTPLSLDKELLEGKCHKKRCCQKRNKIDNNEL